MTYEISGLITADNSTNEADYAIQNAVRPFLHSCTSDEYLNQTI